MASGINLTPDGVPELTKGLETLDKLVSSIGKLAGTGKALEELRKIIVGVGDSGSALGQLQRSVQDLAGIVRGLPVEIRTALDGLKTVGTNAGKALGEGVAAGAKESLTKAKSEVRAQVAELQAAYEAATAKGIRFQPGQLASLKVQGVSLFPSDREILAETSRWRSAVGRVTAAQGEALASLRSVLAEDSSLVLAEMNKFYTGLSASVDRFDAVWAKLGSLATKDNGLRLLSSALHQDSALILAEMAKFYTGLSTSAVQVEAAWSRFGSLATKDDGLRLLSSELHKDSALILAEMAKFYTGVSASATRLEEAWARLGTLATKDDGLRLLSSALHQDSTLILAEMAKFYAGLSASATQIEEAWVRLGTLATKDNGLRLLSSELHKDSALILSEMAKFYTGVSASATRLEEAWARLGTLATKDNGLRLLSSELHKDSALVLSEMAKFYQGVEADNVRLAKAVELKNEIRARLAGGSSGLGRSLSSQPSSQDTLGAMREYYLQAGGTSSYSGSSWTNTVAKAAATPDLTPKIDPAKAAQGANSLNLVSSALAKFTNNAGDAHSAARGLASGFGLLWLTWGNMLPLLAGAALSNGLVQIVKVGAEVGHAFETIRVLSQETGDDIKTLEQTLLDLGQRGVYGPKEIAEAMKTMSLAGVSAKDITTSMKDVINLAVAGTTSLKASSDILTSLSAGFDIPAASYSHIADVLTKAAAVSKASIESMSEAFKRASAVHKLYGVSLEDLATELTLVNNLGIQGTAAGTAVLNMYADMQGRTKKVAEAMQKFGVDVKDANGNMKALVPMAMSVAQALDKMLPNKQNEFLRFITGERGARGMVPIIEAARTMSATSTEALSKLEEQQKKVQDNLAFAALSAAQMAMTPLNLMKEVGNSLETSLSRVFKNVEKDVSVAALTMREAFASDDFVSAVTTLATTIARATVYVVEHLDVIAMVIKAYLVWKAAVVSMAVFGVVEAGIISVTRALVAQRTATLASASAMEVLAAATATGGFAGVAASAARAIPVIGTVVSLVLAGYAAWQLYSSGTKTANEETDKFAKLTGGELLRNLAEEEKKLDRQLQQKREGLALDSAAVGVNLEKLKAENLLNEAAMKAKVTAQETKAAQFAKTYGDKSGPTITAQAELAAMRATYSEMYRQNRNLESDVTDTINRIKLKTLGLRADTSPKAPAVSGLLDFDKFAKSIKAPKASDFGSYTKDLLTEENAAHSARMQGLKREASEEKQILDAKHKALLITEAQYQAQTIESTIKEDKKQTAAIELGWANRNALISASMNSIAEEAGGFTVVSEAAKLQGDAFAALDPKIKALAEGYRKLMVDQGQSNITFEKEIATLKQVVAQREALLSIEFQGKISAEAKAYKDLGRELDVNLQKQRDKLDLEGRMEAMTSVQRAGAQAQLAYEEQSAQAIAKRVEKLQELTDTQAALKSILDTQTGSTVDIDPTGQIAANYDAITLAIQNMTKALAEMRLKAGAGGEIAKQIAEIAQARKEADAMAKDLTKSLADAVMKGSAGFKSLWTGLKNWLKDTFSKLVLQPMLQPIMQSVANQVVGSGLGSAAGSAAGSMAGSAVGGGLGSMLTTGVGGYGAVAGFGAAASYGASALMAGNGLTALSGGMSMAMAGELAQGIGMIAGVAGPLVIAAMALASLDKKATPHVGGYALSDSKGYVSDITAQQGGIKQDDTQTAIAALAKSSANLLNSMSSKFGGTGGFSVRAVFESDSNDPSWALFHLLKDNLKQTGSFDALGTLNSDPSKGLTEFSGMAADALRTALKEMNLPQWAKDQLDALGSGISISDLSTAADKINATQDAFLALTKTLAPMAGSLGQLSNASSDTLYNLATLAGGFDNLTNTLSTYYTNFYSASEQHAAGMANLTAEYNKLNMGALPATKAAFRGVIDQFVAGGGRLQEGGEATYLKLMQLANGFASLDTAVDNSKFTQMSADLLRAQGNELGAVAIERQAELAALQATNPELVDLQKQLWGLADAAAANAKLEQVKAGLDGVASKFMDRSELYSYKAGRIGDQLATAGINVSPDQVLGATKDQIKELWKAVGPDGKIAIEQAYQSWEDLMTLMQQTRIDDFLKGLNTTGEELMGAYDKINPKAKNLVQAWEDTTTKIDDLRSSLNSLLDLHMGETPLETALRNLKDLITKRDDLKAVVKGNEDTIYGLKSSQVSQKGVDYLKNLENNLWASYRASNGDPKIASQLTKVTLDRIKLEGQLKDAAAADAAKLNEKNIQAQKDALQAQIDGYKKLKDMAKELQTFVLDLKRGDLSNQSFAGRLNTAKGMFDTSVQGAMSGDATALGNVQGNAQEYLKQAQQFYGGSTKQYSDIFNSVTSSLNSVIGAGSGVDPMLTAAQGQLDALNALTTTTTDTSDAQIEALENLNAAFGTDVSAMSTAIDAQAKVLKDQLTALEALAEQQAAAITQAGEAYERMIADLDEIAADMRGGRRTAELEAASV